MSPVRGFPLLVAVLMFVVPGSAAAHTSYGTGGAEMPEPPKVAAALCADAAATGGTPWECARGADLTLEGEYLAHVRQVRFVGGRGRRDDRVARPRRAEAHRVQVRVPRAARSGRILLLSAGGQRTVTSRRLRVRVAPARQAAPLTPAPAPGGGVFPVAGPHQYGTETNRFGGGRDHGGQDVFARCGTPLVAIYDAKVQHVATQDRAGHYVVLQRADGESYAYMHLQATAEVAKGQTVRAGQQVGRVGDTGRATGCHLHFEQWTAPGWYEGGKAIDPLPLLRSLDG